jgi:heat shock protein HslJ
VRLLIAIIPLVILFSCKEDDDSDATIFGKWKVEGYVANASSPSKTASTDAFVTFNNDKSVNLTLEINTCTGTFTLNSDTLLIKDIGCTEACCDSEFSLELTELLPRVEGYYFTNGKLNLSGLENLNIRLTEE